MTTETTYITEEMRRAVGTLLGRRVSHPVTDSDLRRWAIAVYWPGPPPAHLLSATGPLAAAEDFNPFAWAVAEASPAVEPSGFSADGVERAVGVPGPALRNILNGGVHAGYGAPIRSGDVITSVNRLAEYRERQGSHGLMLFTVTEDTWTNQRGELVRTTRMTTIRY